MAHATFKKKLLPCLITMAIAGTGYQTAYAAEGEEADKDAEVVEIVGIRDSLKQNLAAKRDADSVVEVITAEDIGKFPDKNLAESLQRVPGVAISRDFGGSGANVAIRGSNPELTSVLLNGQYVASTGWFSQNNDRRSFNMALLPSELVESIEVHKSPSASLDEGGVGGTVVVHTRKPLKMDANTVYLSAEMMVNDNDDTKAPGATVLYSWKNDASNLGFSLTASRLEQANHTYKAENYWEEGWSAAGIAFFEQDRVRDSYDLTVQFSPSDTVDLTAQYFTTKLDEGNTNQNFLVINSHWRDGMNTLFSSYGGQPTANRLYDGFNGTASVPRVDGNGNPVYLPTAGTITGGLAWLAQDTNTRDAEIESEVFTVGADFHFDKLTVHASVGTTGADGGNGGNYNGLWGTSSYSIDWAAAGAPGTPMPFGDVPGASNFTGGTIDINMGGQREMMINPSSQINFRDGSWQALSDGSIGITDIQDDADHVQVDFDFDVSFGVIEALKTGVKVVDHSHEFGLTSLAGSGLDGNLTIADFQDGYVHHPGGGLRNSPTVFPHLDADAFQSYLRAHTVGTTSADGRYVNGFDKQAWGKVNEDTKAIYLQADFGGSDFGGNFGVRYVETDVSGEAYNPANQFSRYKTDADYSDWLPSMNAWFNLSEKMKLRLSSADVMSRAGFTQMHPAYSNMAQVQQTAAKGNIGIQPFRASQQDIGIEYYMDDESYIAFALFTKNIESYITTGTINETILTNTQNGTVPIEYTVTVPVQGPGGRTRGAEFQIQKTFGDFGGIFNYTYVDGYGRDDNGERKELPGLSRNIYNITGFYETESWSTRLAYTYRDDFLAEGLGIGGTSRFLAQDFLDAAVNLFFDNVTVSFEAVNLLNEPNIEVHAGEGSLETLRNYSDYGTRYTIKASVNF